MDLHFDCPSCGLAGSSYRRFELGHDGIEVLECFLHRKRIHLAPQAFPRFQRRFQEMARDLLGERVGDHFARALFVLDPSGVR